MDEETIINELLMSEKNMSNNYSIALNEMSCQSLYKSVLDILCDSKDMARQVYDFAYKSGYYNIKAAKESDITSSMNTYEDKLSEL